MRCLFSHICLELVSTLRDALQGWLPVFCLTFNISFIIVIFSGFLSKAVIAEITSIYSYHFAWLIGLCIPSLCAAYIHSGRINWWCNCKIWTLSQIFCIPGICWSRSVELYFSVCDFDVVVRIWRLFCLSLIVTATFAVCWFPFLTRKELLIQVIRRLFPFARGLFEVCWCCWV